MKKALAELIRLRNDETESDKCEQLISALSEDVMKLSNEEMFYNLPVHVMKEIIEAAKDSDENNKEYVAGLKNIFSRLSQIRPNDAILLFNSEFRILSLNDSMQLLEGMKFNQLLTNILQMHKEERSEVEVDCEYEVEKLKEEVQKLTEKVKELEDENKGLKVRNVVEMKEDDFAYEDRISLVGNNTKGTREMDNKFYEIVGNDTNHTIKTNNSLIKIVGNKKTITIIGDKNQIKTTGNDQTLVINGDENILRKNIGNKKQISIAGNKNLIKKMHGCNSMIDIKGNDNIVRKTHGSELRITATGANNTTYKKGHIVPL